MTTRGVHTLTITFDGLTTTRLCCGSAIGCGQDYEMATLPPTLAHLALGAHSTTMPREPKKTHWDAQRLEDMLSGKEHVPPPKVEAPPPLPSAGVVMSPRKLDRRSCHTCESPAFSTNSHGDHDPWCEFFGTECPACGENGAHLCSARNGALVSPDYPPEKERNSIDGGTDK